MYVLTGGQAPQTPLTRVSGAIGDLEFRRIEILRMFSEDHSSETQIKINFQLFTSSPFLELNKINPSSMTIIFLMPHT